MDADGLDRTLAEVEASPGGSALSALREHVLQLASGSLDRKVLLLGLRPRIWEALFEATVKDENEYSALCQRGPSRLHYKILLGLPRTLTGDADAHRPGAGPARMRLLDAYVHWYDDQRSSATTSSDEAGCATPKLASGSSFGDLTTAQTPAADGEDDTGAAADKGDEDEEEEEDWDAPESAPVPPVTPSAVRAAQGSFTAVLGSTARSVHQHASQRHTDAVRDLATVSDDSGGYSQGMGSVTAVLLHACTSASTPSGTATLPVVAAGSGADGGDGSSGDVLPGESRAFRLLRALLSPGGGRVRPSSSEASWAPLRVPTFYEPGT
jgi:hypothetical protein